jgi:hypothetical protein
VHPVTSTTADITSGIITRVVLCLTPSTKIKKRKHAQERVRASSLHVSHPPRACNLDVSAGTIIFVSFKQETETKQTWCVRHVLLGRNRLLRCSIRAEGNAMRRFRIVERTWGRSTRVLGCHTGIEIQLVAIPRRRRRNVRRNSAEDAFARMQLYVGMMLRPVY